METSQQALRTLEELVLDAGEAVSYHGLAGALCLHVNICKTLIQDFVDRHQAKHGLSVLMLVCGTDAACGGSRVVLCPSADLESVRETLQPVLFEHIYAVSRASAALDVVSLSTAAGGFREFTPSIGAIHSNFCAKRSQEEIGSLKSNSYKAVTKDCATTSKVTNKESFTKQSSTSQVDCKVNGALDVKPSTPTAYVGKLTSSEKPKEPTESKNKPNLTPNGKSKSNISNFFGKSNGLGSKLNSKNKEESKEAEARSYNIKETKQLSNEDKHKNEKADYKQDKKLERLEKKKESLEKNAFVSVSKKNKVDKKRKRVLHVSDSEDSDKEDPFEEERVPDVTLEFDEDVIPPTPNADVVKVTSANLNPKKRRKIVDKTYTTDDGYMVTKKEEILESCSEDEMETKENIVETNIKKEIVMETKIPAVTPKSRKKLTSPQKSKQASIMNFFKKKP